MKLKRLIQVALVGGSILALSACSSPHRYDNNSESSDANGMNGGAQASGMGEGASFGGNMGSQDSLHKRTYYFDYDSSNVRNEDKPAISSNADYLVAHPNAKVTVQGHTDPRGSREYNVALGERRASAVAELLRSKGVNARQIRVVSYGAEQLASPGRSDQDYQMDRRAVIVYSQR